MWKGYEIRICQFSCQTKEHRCLKQTLFLFSLWSSRDVIGMVIGRTKWYLAFHKLQSSFESKKRKKDFKFEIKLLENPVYCRRRKSWCNERSLLEHQAISYMKWIDWRAFRVQQSIDVFRERFGEEDDFLQQNEKAHSHPGHPSILSAHLLPFPNLPLHFRSHRMRTIHLHLQLKSSL